MMRNDYRRSLILLRSNASGYSGHVRLERRTLMGTMYFLVQSPGDCPALRAALVGRGRDGRYFACALGELEQDARGQAVLGYSFDPRDICKRELEQYQLIAITCAGDESCQVALFGNVCGHAELNWEGVRGALCELYAAEDAPGEGGAPGSAVMPELAAETAREELAPGEGSALAEEPAADAGAEEITSDFENVTEYVTNVTGEAAQGGLEAEAARLEDAGAVERAADMEAPEAIKLQPAAMQSPAVEPEAGEAVASDLLEERGVSSSAPWPGAAEALRALFCASPALTGAPDDQCVYVKAPMPEGSGFPYVAAGLLVLGGALSAIRYALPAAWTEEPPAGLEDCAWIGDQNTGWWLTEVPL